MFHITGLNCQAAIGRINWKHQTIFIVEIKPLNFHNISQEEKQIAQYLEKNLCKRPKFFIHREDPNDSDYIAIGRVSDNPDEGLTALATNGISNYPLYGSDGKEYPDTRLELVGACETSQTDDFEQMIFFASKLITKQRWFCAPGTFLNNGVARFGSFGDMQHLYFTNPFAFNDLNTEVFGTRKVSWLSPIPVSSAEVQFARKHSISKLEEAFEDNDLEWFNIRRSSIF